MESEEMDYSAGVVWRVTIGIHLYVTLTAILCELGTFQSLL